MKNKIIFILMFLLSTILFAENVVINGFHLEGEVSPLGIEKLKVDPAFVKYKDEINQVVIGHSQGGLTSIAYAQKMRNIGNSNIKAVITVDSPVTGFAGFDYGYSACRTRLLNGISVHDRAISAALGVGLPQITDILDKFTPSEKCNFLLSFTGDLPMKPLITAILTKSTADSSMKEITDMGRMSPFMTKFVRGTTVKKVRYVHHYSNQLKVGWKRYWWGSRPYLYIARVPSYRYYDKYNITSTPYKNISNMGHIIGTDNDPLRLTGDGESNIRDIKNKVQLGYNIAGGVLAARYWYNPWRWYMSRRCFSAANWTKNFTSEWGRIIGGTSNDGFITTGSQSFTGKQVRTYKIDHVRATPPGLNDNKKSFKATGDAKTDAVYGPGGEIDKLKAALQVGAF